MLLMLLKKRKRKAKGVCNNKIRFSKRGRVEITATFQIGHIAELHKQFTHSRLGPFLIRSPAHQPEGRERVFRLL